MNESAQEGGDRSGPGDDARNTHVLETERVVLALPTAGDVDALFELVGGADRQAICRTLIWDGPDSTDEVAEWVQKCRTETFGDSGFHWVINDRTGALTGVAGTPLGSIGTRPTGVPGRADVGYWLGRAYWGRGVMAEALSAVIALGIDELGFAKIEAEVFVHNDPGRRLVERQGFELEGVVRRAHRKYGEWVDAAIYGIVVD